MTAGRELRIRDARSARGDSMNLGWQARHGGQHRRVLIYRIRGWHVVPLSAWRKP